MALKISKQAQSGASASYWRINALLVNETEKQLQIQLAGYLDEPTRRAITPDGTPQFTPLTFGNQTLNGAAFDKYFPNGVDYPAKASLYEFLKALPDWAGATDV